MSPGDAEISFVGEGDLCDVCGLRYDAADEEHQWLGVELSRARPEEWATTDLLTFCSQEHASEWFLRPLPPLEPYTPPTPISGWREDAVVIAVLTLLGLLLSLGLWTALRFVVDRLG